MLLIVGLGNPGIEYERTRHNIGWWVLDLLRTKLTGLNLRLLCYSRVYELKHELKKEVDFIVYPLTYMNNSGKAVKCLYEPRMDLVVIHDDLDLVVGKTRVRFGGSSAGHKGVSSNQFIYPFYIGISYRLPKLPIFVHCSTEKF